MMYRYNHQLFLRKWNSIRIGYHHATIQQQQTKFVTINKYSTVLFGSKHVYDDISRTTLSHNNKYVTSVTLSSSFQRRIDNNRFKLLPLQRHRSNPYATEATSSVVTQQPKYFDVNEIIDWMNEVKQLINQDSNPIKAQLLYDYHYTNQSMQNLQVRKNNYIENKDNGDLSLSLYQLQSDLLDSWVQYQDELLLDKTNQEVLISTIRYAAENAHNLLEQMEPFFNARTAFLMDSSMMFIISNDDQDDESLLSRNNRNKFLRKNSMINSKSVPSYHVPINEEVTTKCNLVLQTWANACKAGYNVIHSSNNKQKASTSSYRAIPQRAQFLLERMEASYEHAITMANNKNLSNTSNNKESVWVKTASESQQSNSNQLDIMTKFVIVRPTIESYIHVINAWGYSNEHVRGAHAEQIFQRMLQSFPETKITGECYRSIIRAWSYTNRDNRSAFTATGHLMKMIRHFEKSGMVDMEPTLDDYKTVLRAWTKSKEKNSPGKAQSILRIMESAYENGSTMIQPDEDCYRYVLITAAQRPELPEIVSSTVDDVLKKMKNSFFIPDSECYGAAIRTWKNVALNNDVPVLQRDRAARRTLELLEEMKVAHDQSTLQSVHATTENVNDVIEALAASTSGSSRRRVEHAEALLTEMEEAMLGSKDDESLSNSKNFTAMPNADSYRRVIDVWKTTDSSERISRGKAILWRFKDNYVPNMSSREDDDKKKLRNRVISVFNAFIELCSTFRARSEAEGILILREALTAIELIRTFDGLGPNSSTYSSLLQACENVLPVGDERQQLVEKIFHLCCNDGLVDDAVLTKLRSVANSDKYSKLVIAVSEDIDGTRMVPEAWTINALGGRVITADGRRTKPLSIEGRITVTKAMQDFKMRRLRDNRNRNILQGGRQGSKNRKNDVVSNTLLQDSET